MLYALLCLKMKEKTVKKLFLPINKGVGHGKGVTTRNIPRNSTMRVTFASFLAFRSAHTYVYACGAQAL
jgi:hypothetical protein